MIADVLEILLWTIQVLVTDCVRLGNMRIHFLLIFCCENDFVSLFTFNCSAAFPPLLGEGPTAQILRKFNIRFLRSYICDIEVRHSY